MLQVQFWRNKKRHLETVSKLLF